MNHRIISLLSCLLFISPLYAWKGTEAQGEQPIFSGVMKSQEGNTFHCTNIVVRKSHSGHEKILLYEMPKDLKKSAKGNVIPVNPNDDLTTAQLELIKISKIEVPHPRVLWTWKDTKKPQSVAREYIEIIVNWKGGGAVHYLLELGPVDTQRPVKVFCDATSEPIKGVRQDGTLFCANISKKDLRKKGAPFPAIQSLDLDEPCFKLPKENGTMKSNNKK